MALIAASIPAQHAKLAELLRAVAVYAAAGMTGTRCSPRCGRGQTAEPDEISRRRSKPFQKKSPRGCPLRERCRRPRD